MKKAFKIIFCIFLLLVGVGSVSLYREIFKTDIAQKEKISFEVKQGESVNDLAIRLQKDGVIRDAEIFKSYLAWKGIDKKIQFGVFEVVSPITVKRIAESLAVAQSNERSITIIPGWDLRDIAEYFEKEGIVSSTEFFTLTGNPAVFGSWASTTFADYPILKNKPQNVSLEGYLAPETYRIYKNETTQNILKKLLNHRQEQFTTQMLQDIASQHKTVHEVLTMASILEKEVKTPEDRKKVADLFWRRLDASIGLQADSTVHYLSGREGDVFTKAHERQIDSLYNTYKYRGLPPGPISSPSLDSIMAAIYPTSNTAFYFLTTYSGEVIYSRTLDEHNANVVKYLR